MATICFGMGCGLLLFVTLWIYSAPNRKADFEQAIVLISGPVLWFIAAAVAHYIGL